MVLATDQIPGTLELPKNMRKIRIKDRSIVYDIMGTGAVTVLLETGIGAESAEWSSVACTLANHARVLVYDRAGRGASEPACGARDVQDVQSDLCTLIGATDLSPPFVVIGHSFGGVLVRAFAREHRREVLGLVLAESMHPRQFDCLGPLFPSPTESDPRALARMRSFWQGSWKRTDSTREHLNLTGALDKDRMGAGSFGDLPIRVLSAASFLCAPNIADEKTRRALQSQWDRLQRDFHELSSATKAVYLEQSGHFVQRDQPAAIANAALELIAVAGH
jgi:pimeloyl-ACP methyl ester carboxylesterase